jgi:hypothetical protein
MAKDHGFFDYIIIIIIINLQYSAPNIITRHVARMEEMRNGHKILVEQPE